jgi:hypothetical protein
LTLDSCVDVECLSLALSYEKVKVKEREEERNQKVLAG